MRENRGGAKGADRDGNWGVGGIFEVHRTLLVKRTVPTKPDFP